MDALLDDAPQPVEVAGRDVVADVRGRRVEDHDRAHVHVHRVGLEGQESGVHPAEAFHHANSGARRRGG